MTSERMVFDVFGRRILVERTDGEWEAFHIEADGTSRPAKELVIPSELDEAGVERSLADLCHEWATAIQPSVRRIG